MFKTIQRRLTFLIVSLLFISIIAVFYIQQKAFKTAELLVKIETDKLSYLLNESVNAIGKNIYQFNFDYSYWDELIEFSKTLDPEWGKINLESPAQISKFSGVYLLGRDLRLLYGSNLNKLSGKDPFFIPIDELKIILSKELFFHFFYKTQNGITEVYIAPVQPSDDFERKSTPQGWFVTTRVLDENPLSEIKKLTFADTVLVLDTKNASIQRTPQQEINSIVNARYPLKNWDGTTVGILLVVNDNLALREYLKSAENYIPIILVISLFLLIATSVALYVNVTHPISVLSNVLKSGGNSNLQPLLSSKTEFGVLAQLIHKYFLQQNSLHEEIESRKKSETELRIIKEELEERVLQRTKELRIATNRMEEERDHAKLYLDIAGAIICVLDYEGRVILMNEHGNKILGYNNNELIYNNWFEMCVPQNERNLRKIAHQTCFNNFDRQLHESIRTITTKDGEIKTLLFYEEYSSPLLKSQNKMLFSAIDISELIAAKEELIKAKEKAENANQTKSSFFANMSHELRTPLFGILGFAEIMMTSTKDENLVKMSSIIHRSGQRLLETLNKVLNLSRIEAQMFQLSLTSFNVTELLNEIVNLFVPEARKKDLELSFNASSNDIQIYSDCTILTDICNNLIHNAIKFTRVGSIVVELISESYYILIEVRDTGIGIPQESQTFIFEEFRQVSEGYGRNFEGTGLGLAITRKYVDLLNGKITLMSKENSGSTFKVILPKTYKKEES